MRRTRCRWRGPHRHDNTILHSNIMDFIFRSDTDDELSKLKNEAVPDDVRKWLASTFASPDQVSVKYLYGSKYFWWYFPLDCQKSGRETHVEICSQCNQNWDIHWEDLQQNVHIPADGHPAKGGNLSAGTQGLIVNLIIVYSEMHSLLERLKYIFNNTIIIFYWIFRLLKTGTLNCSSIRSLQMEVH